ncbi:MAG: hypothetical protein KC636_16160 [Myxococcales bacterium]|nr:hypothetical protein [Myxococcales bacterium]
MRPDPRRDSLAKRVCADLDVAHVGLGFAAVAVVIAVLVFGLTPTALALGLLAVLAID